MWKRCLLLPPASREEVMWQTAQDTLHLKFAVVKCFSLEDC